MHVGSEVLDVVARELGEELRTADKTEDGAGIGRTFAQVLE